MKKFILIATLSLALIILAACGAGNNTNENDNNLTAQDILQDLDYMLYVLENNFALFDVAYWARGVNIYAIVEDVRAEILANPDMDAYGFYRALAGNFRPLANIGHFGLLDAVQYDYIINNPRAWQRSFFSNEANARLRYPHVVHFYEQNRDRFPQVGWTGGTVSPNNVITNSIEEGRIAYLSIGSFWFAYYFGSDFDNQMLDFFEDIRGYEHLIIDLRNNMGGDPWAFIGSIVWPNFHRRFQIEGYVFLSYGPYAAPYVSEPLDILRGTHVFFATGEELRPIDEMLEEFDLPQLNMDDMHRMDYGFRVHTPTYPRMMPRFNLRPAFGGQIWFLTSPQMGSAAQISAWIAKETPGFATLVGEVTGGMYGGPRTFIALPNSGIVFFMDVLYITDRHGRPLEAGTIPHYFNREGMDALETVLAMIAEQ